MHKLTSRDVLEYFIESELDKPQNAHLRDEWPRWKSSHNFRFYRLLRKWVKSRKDVNPLLTYAFGTLNNKQYRRVKYWYADIIDIQNFYCEAINSRVNNDLIQADQNIEIFAREYSHKYPEFLSKEPISADRQSLVVVQRNCPQANGQYEIIDGVHRAVNMVLSGATQAHAYIAKYQETIC